MTLVDRLWFGDSPAARLGRVALAPVAAAYAGLVASRAGLYDHHLLPTYDTAIPAVSVGNLTVGGTGKTPIAAWIARALQQRERRPGIVIRGYATGDEIAVHRVLNPEVPIVARADRLGGIRALAADGCDVAVLDDGFQHRRARRVIDIVLVSVDAWPPVRWPLPAGPWRESLHALRRAGLILVTRKAVDATLVAAVRRAVGRVAPGVPQAVAALVPDALRTLHGAAQPMLALHGARVCAVAGIGWPAAFYAQLRSAGAQVDALTFRDHHRYTAADITAITRRAPPGTTVVCTLKDAVKLDVLWPREADPLWYVSQRVELEHGAESVAAALDAVPRARPSSLP